MNSEKSQLSYKVVMKVEDQMNNLTLMHRCMSFHVSIKISSDLGYTSFVWVMCLPLHMLIVTNVTYYLNS